MGMEGVTSLMIPAKTRIFMRLLQTIIVTLQGQDSVDFFQGVMANYKMVRITKDVIVGMTNVIFYFILYFFASRHVSKYYVFVDDIGLMTMVYKKEKF